MFINLVRRVVTRDTNVASPNLHKVTSMTVVSICRYESNVIPRVGEIIQCTEKDEAYDVINVIHTRRCYDNLWRDEIFLEVKPHQAVHIHCTGNYSFKEDWPLITNL